MEVHHFLTFYLHFLQFVSFRCRLPVVAVHKCISYMNLPVQEWADGEVTSESAK